MHIHSCLRAALAACVLAVLAAAPASADPVVAKLRVEAGGKALDPGNRYVNDTVTFDTAKTSTCGGSGDSKTLEGPTALGALVQGSDYSRRLRPVEVSDEFPFGLFVCGIGGYSSSPTQFWGLRVNHAEATVGGDQYRVKPNDEVLWSLIQSPTGPNSGRELVLVAPDRTVRKGRRIAVRVLAYDGEGTAEPAAGVALTGGAVTDAKGKARLRLGKAGRWLVRGTRGTDIPTVPTAFCVWAESKDECDGVALERTVGTDGRDSIDGIRAPEAILGRGGRDSIDARGGGIDTVGCGKGRDSVVADEHDRVGGDCEKVTRK
jgi:hypothetical protein